jgi:hypothetical protein
MTATSRTQQVDNPYVMIVLTNALGNFRLFHLIFFSSLICLILSSCKEPSEGIIDVIGSTPIVESVVLSPLTINTDTIYVGPQHHPDDLINLQVLGIVRIDLNGIASVDYSVWEPGRKKMISRGTLSNDGRLPDTTQGDRTYSGWITFSISRVTLGELNIEISARHQAGFRSNTMIRRISITRLNRPPLISDVTAPDTVQRPNQNQNILLTVRVTDPDGLSDIYRTSFNSFLPAGSPSSQNPFYMYDDGSNGDGVGNDGVFSLRIVLPPTAEIGTYRFEFNARDRSNASSNTIIHRMTIIP